MALSFLERKLLILYRKFYGEEYPADPLNLNAHVKMQNMVFILQYAGVNVGDFGFVWDSYYGHSAAEIQNSQPVS